MGTPLNPIFGRGYNASAQTLNSVKALTLTMIVGLLRRGCSAHLAFRYTDDISIPFWDFQPQLMHRVRHKSLHKPSAKERAMRDLYFENRRKYL